MSKEQHEDLLSNAGLSTKAIHAAQDPENWDSFPVVQPIILASTFKLYGASKYEYSRCDNPTRKTLEKALAELEHAKFGLCFSSGIAAITSASFLLGSGDHIILSDGCYGGTHRYYNQCAVANGIQVSNIDMTDLDNVVNALKPNTKMVWMESPSNPTLKIVDIKALCEMVRKTHPDVIIGIDNTFASPYFQNPLLLGVDLVMHSVTKYLNGHADVVMGAILTSDETLFKKLQFLQYSIGGVPSPFDCYLVLRGLKTLSIRMEQHQKNALKIAKWLEANPRIERVLYPLLPSHPQHEIAKKQMSGFGGMVGFAVNGDAKQCLVFFKALKLILAAVSLGGVESLIEHPASLTHVDVPLEQRIKLGITDNFIRFSIGIEDSDDLIADLDQALEKTIPLSK